MEKYIVSARKHRPTIFEDVVGQSHITTTLKNAIKNNQLAQAFLFCGPRGVGKTTCARILAKSINCLDKTTEAEPCNKCDSCQSFNRNASFNIHELDAASNNSVDDIRNLVEQIRYVPQSGNYKVYIIDEVHMLSNAAFNAFLKTLEEPPSYAIFILATTEKHKIIPTILSRCQIYDFNRITPKDISSHLKNIADKDGIYVEDEALNIISKKADGALRDALSMFDLIVTFGEGKKLTYKSTIENLHVLDYEYYFNVVDALNTNNVSKLFELVDKVIREGFDGLNFMVGLSEHVRKLMILKHPEIIDHLGFTQEMTTKYLSQANELDFQYIVEILNIASKCELDYKLSKNKRLCVELALINMTKEQILISRGNHIDTSAKKIPDKTEQEKKKSQIVNSNRSNYLESTFKTKITNLGNSSKTIKDGLDKSIPSANKDEKLIISVPTYLEEKENKYKDDILNTNKEDVKKESFKEIKEENILTSSKETIISRFKKDEKKLPTILEKTTKGEVDILDPQKPLHSTSTIRILDLDQISKKIKKSVVKSQEINANTDTKDLNEPLDKENAKKGFQEYLEKIKSEGRLTEFNILQNLRIESNTLIFEVNSNMQKDFFDDIKQEIKEYLEYKLPGQKFNLKSHINLKEKIKIPYTNREKFEYLAKKNEALYNLQKKFELDLDI